MTESILDTLQVLTDQLKNKYPDGGTKAEHQQASNSQTPNTNG